MPKRPVNAVLTAAWLTGCLAALQPADGEPLTASPGPSALSGHVLPSLAAQVVDPTAPLLQIAFDYDWSPSTWGQSGNTQTLRFKPTVPFTTWGQPNVFRLTMPYDVVTHNGQHGLGETELFDIVVFHPSWGRWVLGAVVNFEPPATTTETFQAGPVAGFKLRRGDWTLGLFNRNFFSTGVAKSWLQPVLAYTFTPWLALSTGTDMQISYDWEAGKFDQVPLELQLDLTPRLGSQSVYFYASSLYNFADVAGQFRWRFIFGAALLFPGER